MWSGTTSVSMKIAAIRAIAPTVCLSAEMLEVNHAPETSKAYCRTHENAAGNAESTEPSREARHDP
jgi:hypothetical protein